MCTRSLALWSSLGFDTERFSVRYLHGVVMDVAESVQMLFWHWKQDKWSFALLRKTLFSNFAVMKFGNIVPDIWYDIAPDMCNDVVSNIGYYIVFNIGYYIVTYLGYDISYDIAYDIVTCELEKVSM